MGVPFHCPSLVLSFIRPVPNRGKGYTGLGIWISYRPMCLAFLSHCLPTCTSKILQSPMDWNWLILVATIIIYVQWSPPGGQSCQQQVVVLHGMTATFTLVRYAKRRYVQCGVVQHPIPTEIASALSDAYKLSRKAPRPEVTCSVMWHSAKKDSIPPFIATSFSRFAGGTRRIAQYRSPIHGQCSSVRLAQIPRSTLMASGHAGVFYWSVQWDDSVRSREKNALRVMFNPQRNRLA